MVDASDVKESIQANTLYGFSDYDYIDNHKCYNFFDYDWFKKLLFSANSLAKISCSLIRSVIILVTKKKPDSRCVVVRFCYHSYDYRPNWTPLSLITITYYVKF